MKVKRLAISYMIAVSLLLTLLGCKTENNNSNNVESITLSANENNELEVWEMEEKYWEYVEQIDTVSYKKLWHDDFIGYPSFGDGVSTKKGIAAWIPELHQDTSLRFRAILYKRAVNDIEGVVMVFYDADETWNDKENRIVKKETYKFTHTWKKYNGNWVILGGMAAKKNQDTLNN